MHVYTLWSCCLAFLWRIHIHRNTRAEIEREWKANAKKRAIVRRRHTIMKRERAHERINNRNHWIKHGNTFHISLCTKYVWSHSRSSFRQLVALFVDTYLQAYRVRILIQWIVPSHWSLLSFSLFLFLLFFNLCFSLKLSSFFVECTLRCGKKCWCKRLCINIQKWTLITKEIKRKQERRRKNLKRIERNETERNDKSKKE